LAVYPRIGLLHHRARLDGELPLFFRGQSHPHPHFSDDGAAAGDGVVCVGRLPLLLLAVVAYNQAQALVSARDPTAHLARLLRLELFIWALASFPL
jgi:hypothetical protein